MPTIPTERLRVIEKKLYAAEAPGDFVPELAREWNRSIRQVWKYVAIVRKRIAEQSKLNSDPEADREIAKQMLLEAYRTARVGSPKFGADGRTMVQAVRVYAELTGALSPQQVNHNVNASVVVLPDLEESAVGPEQGTPNTIPGK
mgnify:CR=1 FL=1